MPVVIPVAGLSPAGLFVSQDFATEQTAPGILADAIDGQTGEYLSIVRGQNPIDAQVIVALTRVRGSGAAVASDGHRFKDIKVVNDAAQALIDSQTRLALERLVDKGDIAIVSITTQATPGDDFGWTFLQYRNLRTKGPQQRSLKIAPT